MLTLLCFHSSIDSSACMRMYCYLLPVYAAGVREKGKKGRRGGEGEEEEEDGEGGEGRTWEFI